MRRLLLVGSTVTLMVSAMAQDAALPQGQRWACAVNAPVYADVRMFQIRGKWLYDSNGIETWVLGTLGPKLTEKQRTEALEKDKYEIVADKTDGLIAIKYQIGTFGEGDQRTHNIYANVVMIDKQNGWYRSLGFSQAKFQPGGKESVDQTEYGTCRPIK